MTIPEIVDFYGKRGFGAIAITDVVHPSSPSERIAAAAFGRSLTPSHYPIYAGIIRSEAERALKRYNMLVIPGIEIASFSLRLMRPVRIVGIGVDKFIPSTSSLNQLSHSIRVQGGIAIAAHVPTLFTNDAETQNHSLWRMRTSHDNHWDAWQVSTDTHLFDSVLRSSLPKIAMNTFRSPDDLSSWKTLLSCERKTPAVLSAIRDQEVRFQYHEGRNPDESHFNRMPLRLLRRRFNRALQHAASLSAIPFPFKVPAFGDSKSS